MDFSGKTIIVTGAGGGIGEGYAKACAERGMHVVIAELNEEGGQRVASEINAAGGSALFVPTDVGSESLRAGLCRCHHGEIWRYQLPDQQRGNFRRYED